MEYMIRFAIKGSEHATCEEGEDFHVIRTSGHLVPIPNEGETIDLTFLPTGLPSLRGRVVRRSFGYVNVEGRWQQCQIHIDIAAEK